MMGQTKAMALALRKAMPEIGVILQSMPQLPVPGPDDVAIDVEAAGICGTDLHIADWTPGYESMIPCMPVTLGHEFSGRVRVGPEHLLGKRVVTRPSVTCGQCPACTDSQLDREDTCENRRGIGIHRDGAFATRVQAPARNCIVVPDTLDAELAALTEPMTVAAHTIDKADPVAGKHVLIIGPGPIGLGAALFARRAGAAHVAIMGKHDEARLQCARRLGFDHLTDLGVDPSTERQGEIGLNTVQSCDRYDVIIEATGVPEVASQSQTLLKKGGILVICGIHARPATLDLTLLVRNEQRLAGSYRAPVSLWPWVMNVLAEDAEIFRRLITHRLPLAAAMDGFALMRNRQAVKVMIQP